METYIVKLDRVKMRNPKNLKRVGRQIKMINKRIKQKLKKGYVVENLNRNDHYKGKGLWYGVTLRKLDNI